jgi:hypothetical protein
MSISLLAPVKINKIAATVDNRVLAQRILAIADKTRI